MNGEFIVYSQECTEIAGANDYFCVDSTGAPYPISEDYVKKNFKPLEGNKYATIPTPLKAWNKTEPITDEITSLLENGKLKWEDGKFAAELWGTSETQKDDAEIVIYGTKADGNIDFNIVEKNEFDKTYDRIDAIKNLAEPEVTMPNKNALNKIDTPER